MFIPIRDDNPLRRILFHYVTTGLVAACVLVWIVQAIGGESFDAELIFRLGLIPVTVLGDLQREPAMVTVPPWLTIFTSMFLHGGFWHLFGNMLFLWVFGDNVEDAMGHGRFALFYVLCGAVAGLTHAGLDPASQIPTIGASGAVSGVLGAYLMLHPKRKIWIFIVLMPLRVPAWGALGGWIAFQVIAALAFGGQGGGIAWYAHIGGFAAGVLLIVPFRKRGVPLFDRAPVGPWNRRATPPPDAETGIDALWERHEPGTGDPGDSAPPPEDQGPWGPRSGGRGPWSRED